MREPGAQPTAALSSQSTLIVGAGGGQGLGSVDSDPVRLPQELSHGGGDGRQIAYCSEPWARSVSGSRNVSVPLQDSAFSLSPGFTPCYPDQGQSTWRAMGEG